MTMEWVLQLLKFFNNLFTILPRKQIEKVVNIYDSMHKVMELTNVERFLIIKTHNGGGLIKPTTPLYISCVYEDYTHPLHSIKNDIQDLLLDEEFIRIILDLCRAKSVRLYTKDIKSKVLKNFLERDKITFIELRFIKEDRKNLYFSTFVTTGATENFDTPVQQSSFLVAINNIGRNI